MHKIVRSFFVFVVTISILSSPVAWAKDAHVPSKKVQWAWRKQFHGASLGNLCLAWNGSRIVFSVTETGSKAGKGDVMVGLNENGRPLNDWKVAEKVTRLSLNGKGVKLLAELANGSILFYENWEKSGKPRLIKTSSSGAVFSPEGDLIALARGAKDKQGPKVISSEGKMLWLLPDNVADSANLIFPFLNQKKAIIRTTSGSLSMSEEGKLLWKAALPGTPVSLASSFLEGGLIAVTTAGEQGEIRFYDSKGAQKGSAPFPGGAHALSCSDIGLTCAALSNGPAGQRLSFFTQDGKERWIYRVKTTASANAPVAVSGHGQIIIGGFEENGQWYLHAWDINGNSVWTAPIDGGLADFKVSWNGKRIAVLTKNGRIAFYDLTEKKDEKPAKVGPAKRK